MTLSLLHIMTLSFKDINILDASGII